MLNCHSFSIRKNLFASLVFSAATAIVTSVSASAFAASCPLPWGGVLADGDSVIAWNYPAPPHGTHCRSEIRSCEAGFLTGSYSSAHCSEPARFFDFHIEPLLISFRK